MRLALRAVLLATLAAGLGGCASVPETAAPSPVEVPSSWASPTPPLAATTDEAWWRGFGDADLDRLVEEALSQNHDLSVAVARVDAAAAQARIAGADAYPTLGLGVSGQRAKRNFIGFPIPGAGDRVLSTTSTNLGLSLETGWEADLWGRLRARQRAAVAELTATRADRRAAELSLSAAVVRSWLSLIEAGQQVELAGRTLESRRSSRARVEARYRRGLSASLDLRLARSEEALARSSLEQRRREREGVRRQLEVLLGRYPDASVSVPAVLPQSLPAVPAGLPAELVTRRPDLAAAELRLVAAGAQVAEARRALYPRLTLTGSGGSASSSLRDLLDGDFSVWALAGGLLQPLFQGGRLRAAVELAQAGEEAQLARYLQRTLDAFAEVENALAAESFLADQSESLRVAATESAEAERLAMNRYGAGLESYLSVLEAQRQSFLAEAQLLGRRRDLLLARVDLVLALGGGFGATGTMLPAGEAAAAGQAAGAR